MGSRSVLISGASSGIGEATARSLVQKGWNVFAGVRTSRDARRLEKNSPGLRPVLLDVTCQESIEKVVQHVRFSVGEEGLDGLINNAGIGYIGPAEHIPLDDLRHNFEVNVFGLLALTQMALPLLKKGKPGRVVNIGSIAGLHPLPYAASYCATKHALEALSDALRHELRPSGVSVSLVRPGPIRTNIFQKSADHAAQTFAKKQNKIDKTVTNGLQVMAETAVRTGKTASTTEQVVRVIEEALTENQPKPYYFDSWETALRSTCLSLIPSFYLDSVYDRFFHLSQP